MKEFFKEEMLEKRRPPEFGEQEQPVFNVFRTLAHYPALMRRLAPWGNHVLFKSSLPPREREMAILRTGWLAKASYEWSHHCEIGLHNAGLTDADIENIMGGPGTPGLPVRDRHLLKAVDELVEDCFLSDQSWTALQAAFSLEQIMDLIFAVGHYYMMCMALNSMGVQLES